MTKLIRLQVEVTEDQMNELDRLQGLGGLRTKRELVNNAFTLLQWAAREKVHGNSIVSVNEKEGTYKELEMPYLEHIVGAAAGEMRAAVSRDVVPSRGSRWFHMRPAFGQAIEAQHHKDEDPNFYGKDFHGKGKTFP